MAEDYEYLTFTKTDGTTQSVSAANLTITIVGTNLVAVNNSGTITLPLSKLSKMAFTGATTAVANVENNTGSVKVYQVNGMYVGEFSSAAEAVKQLAKGEYVIKSNNQTSKVSVQ